VKRRMMGLIAILIAVTLLVAWSILDNTKAALLVKPQQITSEASSSAIDLRGYERMHVLIATTFDSAATVTDTLRVDILEAPSAASTYTIAQTATFTGAMDGFLEFEVIKDMSNPYVKVKLTPSATMIISVMGVYYGATNAPF